jgi:glycine oxidase
VAAQSSDVVVVGGGVIGCAVAFQLAREGLSVTLFERGEIAGEASGAAAGMLTPVGEAGEGGAFVAWKLRSLALFPGLLAELRERSGVDPEYQVSGVLRVAGDAAEEASLRGQVQELPELELVWLDAGALKRAEPQLAPQERGGLLSPREAHVRSPLLVRAYAQAAASLGARLRAGLPVTGLVRERARVVGVETPEGRHGAAHVVLCPGSWARACAAWVAPFPDLPVAPVRGQIVCLDAPHPALRSIVWGPGAYLVPKLDGSVVVGATSEHAGFDRRVTAAGVAALLEAAARLVPALADASFRSAWAGLRPATPDGLPLVGPLPEVDGLVVAAGHYRNGVLLSPLTGRMVADGLLGKGWAEPAFLPERWLRPGRSADASGP